MSHCLAPLLPLGSSLQAPNTTRSSFYFPSGHNIPKLLVASIPAGTSLHPTAQRFIAPVFFSIAINFWAKSEVCLAACKHQRAEVVSGTARLEMLRVEQDFLRMAPLEEFLALCTHKTQISSSTRVIGQGNVICAKLGSIPGAVQSSRVTPAPFSLQEIRVPSSPPLHSQLGFSLLIP